MLNRLVYDSNYIDFIKELSTFEGHKSIVNVLDNLKKYKKQNEVHSEKNKNEGKSMEEEVLVIDKRENISPIFCLQAFAECFIYSLVVAGTFASELSLD